MLWEEQGPRTRSGMQGEVLEIAARGLFPDAVCSFFLCWPDCEDDDGGSAPL